MKAMAILCSSPHVPMILVHWVLRGLCVSRFPFLESTNEKPRVRSSAIQYRTYSDSQMTCLLLDRSFRWQHFGRGYSSRITQGHSISFIVGFSQPLQLVVPFKHAKEKRWSNIPSFHPLDQTDAKEWTELCKFLFLSWWNSFFNSSSSLRRLFYFWIVS